MKRAECAFRPFVKSPFYGPFSGQPEHNESLREKKEEESERPNRDRSESCGGRYGKPSQAYDRADVEKDEVAEAEFPLQFGRHAGIMAYLNSPQRLENTKIIF